MRKIKLLLLFSLVVYTAKAQYPQFTDSLSYAEEATSALKPLLDKDSALYKNQILYDKVMLFSNLYNFNTTEHNTADKELFIQALSELHRAGKKH